MYQPGKSVKRTLSLAFFRRHFLLLLLLSSWQWQGVFAQNVSVLNTVPANEARDSPCKTFITVKLQFREHFVRIDPLTLHGNAIRLFPIGRPMEQVNGAIYYLYDEHVLRMDPLGELAPLTTYIFEITNQLTDDQGNSFKPFMMSFTTGDCQNDPQGTLAEVAGEERGMPQPYTKVDRLNATLEHADVVLEWSTEHEFMNADFSIDRSRDGGQFEILDRIPSSGDSEAPQTYQWVDERPFPGINYYRLTQVDVYGSITQTDTISVFLNGVQFARDRIPRNGALIIEFIGEEKTTMALVLKSSTGKVVKRKAGFVSGGTQQVSIPLDGIPPGKYIAILKTHERALTQEIIITPP